MEVALTTRSKQGGVIATVGEGGDEATQARVAEVLRQLGFQDTPEGDIVLGPRSMMGAQRMHVVAVVASRVAQYGVRCAWIDCRGAGEPSVTKLDHGFIGRTLRNQRQLNEGAIGQWLRGVGDEGVGRMSDVLSS